MPKQALLISAFVFMFAGANLLSAAFSLEPAPLEKKFVIEKYADKVVELPLQKTTTSYAKFFAVHRTIATLCENLAQPHQTPSVELKSLLNELLKANHQKPLSEEALTTARALLNESLEGTNLYEISRFNFLNDDGMITEEIGAIISTTLNIMPGFHWYCLMQELEMKGEIKIIDATKSYLTRKKKSPRQHGLPNPVLDEVADDEVTTALEFILGHSNRSKRVSSTPPCHAKKPAYR